MIDEPRPMKEIHEIQEKLYEERKGMTDEEILEDFHRTTEELIHKFGLKIKTTLCQKVGTFFANVFFLIRYPLTQRPFFIIPSQRCVFAFVKHCFETCIDIKDKGDSFKYFFQCLPLFDCFYKVSDCKILVFIKSIQEIT